MFFYIFVVVALSIRVWRHLIIIKGAIVEQFRIQTLEFHIIITVYSIRDEVLLTGLVFVNIMAAHAFLFFEK